MVANQARTPVRTPQGSAVVISNVEDLKQALPLSSADALVVTTTTQLRGDLLAALGRISVEYPALKKFAVMAAPPSLPVAVFLGSCGVRMSWPGREADEREE
jgi:hypothetical protein